ncbi:MAG TPA: hypothetical protein VMR33_04140 [Candidatus Baltobacteraceae bacterium]|nr:hypothetical protein [Candidatus Baltobacteraceae bacterium]
MNEQEQERYEAELRRTPPARLPEQFLARLKAAKPSVETMRPEHPQRVVITPGWWRTWPWLAPALAAAVAGLLVVRANFRPGTTAKIAPPAATYGLMVDDVQVDHELVSSYDVVAKLPSGEPVRFHCRKWNDQLVLIDTNGGVQIEQNSPRVEVVPVRIETY